MLQTKEVIKEREEKSSSCCYPYPEEVCDLKRVLQKIKKKKKTFRENGDGCVASLYTVSKTYLKQGEMDEMENQLGTTEPEVLIVALYKWHSLNHCVFIRDPKSHPCHDGLKLCPYS